MERFECLNNVAAQGGLGGLWCAKEVTNPSLLRSGLNFLLTKTLAHKAHVLAQG